VKRAVIVIDVQQGLCEGPNAAYDCAGTIARINSVTQAARSVGAPVIFVQHEGKHGYLAHQNPAWELAKQLAVNVKDLCVRKTTPDSFHKTTLLELLRIHQIEQLVVCGMHTEFCVDTTVRRALALGFPVTLVADAHTSCGNAAISAQQVIAHHNTTLQNITSFGPRVDASTAQKICTALGQ
jgi:nicotinamidase-related amidase